jgi:hypothetical protein
VADILIGCGKAQRRVARGSARAAQILGALGIREIDQAQPPAGRDTVT